LQPDRRFNRSKDPGLKGKIISSLILIVLHIQAQGQDPFFSQFFNSILYLNPAYVGSAHQPRISAAYRNQMPAFGSPWVTYNASYDQPVRALQGGLGVNVMNDVQGPALNRISTDVMYAYFLPVNQNLTLHAGFQASYVHRFLRTSDLVMPDQVNLYDIPVATQESAGNLSKGYPDFAVGFVAFTRNYYAGVSMHHLAKPDLSYSSSDRQPLSRKLTVHGGAYIALYERRLGREALKLNPNLVYLHQAGFRQINYGLDVIYKVLYCGLWFRHNIDLLMNAFIINLGYEHDYFRIGYSHDFAVSSPWRNMQNMGSHEITFLLKLEYKGRPRERFRTIKSPKI
jgi:type IX secretion system PorP/SprF family membrane protein